MTDCSTVDPRPGVADRLEQASHQISTLDVFIGLDGFVDEIFHVVDKRESASVYTRLPTIQQFSQRLADAAGRSTNIEMVSQLIKLGGNGPIMANALAALGLRVSYLGNLGYPNLHPVFEEFARHATVHSIAEPGLTDALEFEDGKVMVGKHQSLKDVTWDNICSRFGLENLKRGLASSSLVSFVNWTMLTAMSEIWESIQRDVIPNLTDVPRVMFIDLADPEKRTHEDIARALKLIEKFQARFEVILGLNEKESFEIAEVLKLEAQDHSPAGLCELASQIRHQTNINTVVIHPVSFAVAANGSDTAAVEGPLTSKPLITTGAGDHFNAGYCLARMLALTNEESLWTGVATSGYYVRNAKSPTVQDLIHMLRNWPARENNSTR